MYTDILIVSISLVKKTRLRCPGCDCIWDLIDFQASIPLESVYPELTNNVRLLAMGI